MKPTNSFEAKFQRDLNRIIDSDRNTRKRGLQKLVEDIPWNSVTKSKDSNEEFSSFAGNTLFRLLLGTIADPVEKCRELTLTLLQKIISLPNENIGSVELIVELTKKLTHRVGEQPFPEPAEELRLQIVDILLSIQLYIEKNCLNGPEVLSILSFMLEAISKALNDNFPAVKRSCAELVRNISITSPHSVRLHLKSLLKGLAVNILHQHAKTRVLTLQALGQIITCASQAEYESVMAESIIPIFSRLLPDRSVTVKLELAQQAKNILINRWQLYRSTQSYIVAVDLELITILLLLSGEDTGSEIAIAATESLQEVSASWDSSLQTDSEHTTPNINITDGELELQKSSVTCTIDTPKDISTYESSSHRIHQLIQANFKDLSSLFIRGIEEWTTENKTRYLRGFSKLIEYGEESVLPLLPLILTVLGQQIRQDSDSAVRVAGEQCCVSVGQQAGASQVLEVLLPRLLGEVPGGDTSSQRTCAARLLTHTLMGFPLYRQHVKQHDYQHLSQHVDQHVNELENEIGIEQPLQSVESSEDAVESVERIASALSDTALYEFREVVLREAALLLVRALHNTYPKESCQSESVQKSILLALLYLTGKPPGEEDIVHDVAAKELRTFAVLVAHNMPSNANSIATTEEEAVKRLLQTHFQHLVGRILHTQLTTASDPEALRALNPRWEAKSSGKAAFEALIRNSASAAWAYHALVLPVFCNQVQPPVKPAAGSAEANMQSYAAQRGEEVLPNTVSESVDVRLALLALLEGLIRSAASDWQSGSYLAASAESIVKEMVVPNLVWRIGRVESTVRKVALAMAYGVLKAGALKPEQLVKTASELVPLIVSNLDDMESTPRQIACLCLTVLFERLRGGFGDSAVREVYPKLIARLDDSNDAVRISVCGTLQMFLQCAHKSCFTGTVIDYMLDQLFIHLDDPDPNIQQAVYPVIVVAANAVDKALVLRKAESSKSSHRSSALCNRLIVEVQGF
eukprot:CAMPEP_0201114058 /NCGR_PEP_ID=MMETSP0812-20130820/78180_1 /ASSEMBLY_ACC=CAM_ASM_000668 /TAXON_ID=98059 /ORGANISM="Dinobryon sp., Strain UTEXLB2267" /LENGTH=977 /DNA_ID=CAMNT_0047377649 /DNA_START=1245 /DNA_END=4175 /DNA_ORIENTATION=+